MRKSDFTLPTLDDLFSTQAERDDAKLERVRNIPLAELHPFKGHPFKVQNNEEMQRMIESIRKVGAITPALARSLPGGGYELISGHRRLAACQVLGVETVSFQGKGEKAKPVSLAQYIMHYAYGASEPTILKTGDILMRGYEGATTEEKREFYKKLMAKMENTSKTGNYFLPHGIILSQKAAENVIDFVYTVEVGAGAHVSAGPCICEVALKKYPEGVTEPEIKDLTLYYGADIYENLPLGHHPVTKEEAKEILADMHKKGYVHNVLYMFGKKSGAFVMCNCDREVCAVVKGTRILGPGINCEKGPEVIKRDRSKCLGAQECGMCVKRCPFGANKIKDGMVIFDKEKCMGCELCVATCKGCARELEERKDYGYDEVMHRELLLAGKYGRPELDTVTLEDNNREE